MGGSRKTSILDFDGGTASRGPDVHYGEKIEWGFVGKKRRAPAGEPCALQFGAFCWWVRGLSGSRFCVGNYRIRVVLSFVDDDGLFFMGVKIVDVENIGCLYNNMVLFDLV